MELLSALYTLVHRDLQPHNSVILIDSQARCVFIQSLLSGCNCQRNNQFHHNYVIHAIREIIL